MKDLKVALIQSDLHWQNSDANLAMFEEKIWKITGRPDIVVLPEMFSTGFTTYPTGLGELHNGKTFRWMKQMAAQTKAVVIGSYIISGSSHYFNRLYAVRPDGSYTDYNKRHLFSLAKEHEQFSAGKRRTILEINGWKILPLVCYDLRFPVWARSRQAADMYEYDVLIFVANWPERRIQAWDTLLGARAIENSSYCIGVNRIGMDGNEVTYPGHSAIYDFYGHRLCHNVGEDSVLEWTLSAADLQVFREKFPFQRDSDYFHIELER